MEIYTDDNRIHIDYEESSNDVPISERNIRFFLKPEKPYLGDENAFQIQIGSSIAQTRIISHKIYESKGDGIVGYLCVCGLSTIAQLWHALNKSFDKVPILFIGIREKGIIRGVEFSGYILSQDIREFLNEMERRFQLDVKTQTLDIPIYLNHFWGPRRYGRLDAMISRLKNFKIVPETLLEKASLLDAKNNWAIIHVKDMNEKQQILEALEPLIQFRKGILYELDEGQDSSTIDQFLVKLSDTPVEERPYYLLILGGLDEFSIEFQYFLQSFGAAGRLAFSKPDDYRVYAEKVLHFENKKYDKKNISPTYIATDYDDVNARNYKKIIQPLIDNTNLPKPRYVLARGRADKRRVLESLREAPENNLAFISAHGFEHNSIRGYDDALEVLGDSELFQGSLILDDYLSPRELGTTEGMLTAHDVKGNPIMPGGIMIFHSCYSAGTIHRDTMPEWISLQMPERVKPRKPFISSLAKALLANPKGPLALYAHINRSHQYDYFDPENKEDNYPYRHYYKIIDRLIKGQTIGLSRENSHRMVIEYMDQVMTISYQIEALMTGYSSQGRFIYGPSKPLSNIETSFMQYSFATCNYRNYIILGDPMTRIGL